MSSGSCAGCDNFATSLLSLCRICQQVCSPVWRAMQTEEPSINYGPERSLMEYDGSTIRVGRETANGGLFEPISRAFANTAIPGGDRKEFGR